MRVSIQEADGQLAELVKRAEAGEDVVLTLDGRAAVRLTPVVKPQTVAERRRILEEISASGAAKALPGPSAARSQDYLYGDDGLPA